MNKHILIGNVGRKPVLQYTRQGVPCARFTVASHWGERTEWHHVTVMGPYAHVVAGHLDVGQGVAVDGRLHYYRSKADPLNIACTTMAESVRFLDGARARTPAPEQAARNGESERGDNRTE